MGERHHNTEREGTSRHPHQRLAHSAGVKVFAPVLPLKHQKRLLAARVAIWAQPVNGLARLCAGLENVRDRSSSDLLKLVILGVLRPVREAHYLCLKRQCFLLERLVGLYKPELRLIGGSEFAEQFGTGLPRGVTRAEFDQCAGEIYHRLERQNSSLHVHNQILRRHADADGQIPSDSHP